MLTIIGLAIIFAGVLVILNDMTGLGIFIIIIGCLFLFHNFIPKKNNTLSSVHI